MAKELPYFKFEPSEYDSGRIQMCSFEAQGLFINICSLYWSRLGDLPEKLVMHKLCRGYANAYQELCNEKVLHVKEDIIIIKFLDEQLQESGTKSDKARKAANERWKKYRETVNKEGNNANAMQTHNESITNAMPIEENRIEKNKKEKNSLSSFSEKNQKYVNFSKEFYNQLKLRNKIKGNHKLNDKIIDNLRLLIETDLSQKDDCFEQIKKLCEFYFVNFECFEGELGYMTEVYSLKALRTKYISLRDMCNKLSRRRKSNQGM